MQDYKLDRVPIEHIERLSKRLGIPAILVVMAYIMINQGSVLAMLITFIVSIIIIITLKSIVYKLLVFVIGVPITLISNLLPVKRNSKKFIEYAYEHLDELYVKRMIDKKYYEEGIQYIEEIEYNNL